MKVLPSTSVIVTPSALGARRPGTSARAGSRPRRSSRAPISRDRGPGISVFSSIVRVVATQPAYRTARDRIAAWFFPIGRSRACSSEGRIEIDPYDPSLLQPSSVDVRVDRYFRVFRNNLYPLHRRQGRAGEPDRARRDRATSRSSSIPGEFVLGSTLERVRLPDDLVARLEGKSALGRLGLLIHSTAGFIDPGWDGHVTLELSNVANLPITIYHGMKIGQLSFVQLTEPAREPVRLRRPRLEVPGPARADAEPLLAELRPTEPYGRRDPCRHRRQRPSSGAKIVPATASSGLAHALRAKGGRAGARPPARAGERSSRSWGVELAHRRRDRRRRAFARPPTGCTHVVHLVAILRGRPADFQRVMVDGFRNVLSAARGRGRRARVVLMSALGTGEATKDDVPYFAAKWQMEHDLRGLRARARDLPAELRLRTRRRSAAARSCARCGSPRS